MMHSDVERDGIVERYVRRELTPDQQLAFEEHFFGCDECFESVQTAERFQVGMRDAARRGLLDAAARSGARRWVYWGLTSTVCATLVLAAAAGWMYFQQLPRLHEELDRTAAQLAIERQARADLARAIPPGGAGAPGGIDAPEGNVALVMLAASRASEKPAAILSANAKRLVLWIDIGSSRYRRFHLDVRSSGNQPIASLDQLQRNAYGALVASLPADKLPTGDLRITLTGQDPAPASLVGEYQLRIEKR